MSSIPHSIQVLARNAILSALVFLPVFLVGVALEGMIRFGSLEGGGHFGYALFLYVAYAVPVVLGSFVHSVAVILVCTAAPAARRQTVVFLLSPLLCVTVLLLGGADGAAVVLERPAAALLATIAYGLASALLPRRRLVKPV
ncbi:MAG: hypothetical protein HKP36_05370 [Myxococcales bacterium]|nr:hypothetical protein [Deltaproteobacteria bacterium]NNL23862.1 hypothetical protein [Myxococcales bacterium]